MVCFFKNVHWWFLFLIASSW